jgi:hypothetical protein
MAVNMVRWSRTTRRQREDVLTRRPVPDAFPLALTLRHALQIGSKGQFSPPPEAALHA